MKRLVVSIFATAIAATPCIAHVSDQKIDEEDRRDAAKEHLKSSLTLSPYLWGPSLSGMASLGPINAPVNLNLSELASGIKIGGMGHLQYNRENLFVYAEAIGARFGDPEFATFGNQSVKTHAILLETGAGIHHRFEIDENRSLEISPYAGVRYVELKAAINGPLIITSGENEWIDPVIGTIARFNLNDRWALVGKADVAGLFITVNSYRNFALGLEHRVNSRLSFVGGYRSTSGKFTADRGLTVDLDGNGPIVGLRYTLRN
ncbi:hypothetical protein [Parasphingorhabdus sp.]|uniref:hypothetical protein n=1 Tax=Parasphingorhabdus sp. TaxID=2709688 RepID=UPI0032EF044B